MNFRYLECFGFGAFFSSLLPLTFILISKCKESVKSVPNLVCYTDTDMCTPVIFDTLVIQYSIILV